MTPNEALDQAAAELGSMQALGESLGVTKGAVGQWKLDGRRVPAEHCPAIERLTSGKVRCESLRPDVDWAYIREHSSCGTVAGSIDAPAEVGCSVPGAGGPPSS